MNSELPAQWEVAKLGDVASFVMGQAPPGSECNKDGNGTPFVKAGEFRQERPVIHEWTTRPLKMASRDDVLICVVGATAGKLNLGEDCAIGRSVAAIRPHGEITNRFIIIQLLPMVPRLRAGSAGSAQGVISQSDLERIPVVLPPLNEQRRIVAKIEALLARSARAKEALDAIPALLDRYRQSVLAAAFRGDLTADWRAEHPDVEPASELLERIRDEHRNSWNGSRRSGTFRGLSSGLPQKSDDLPDCWRVVTGCHLFQWGSGKNLPSKQFQEGSVPVFGGNGVSGYHSEALIDHPTIVIGRVGALCGNVYSSTGPCWVTDNAIYASYVPSIINIEFIKHAFEIANLNKVATGSGQPFVNQAILNATELPLPPLVEQDEICRLLADAFGAIEKVVRAWKVASARLPDMNQSILAKAFRGELVPQDPNDEPASELLARIKAQRAANPLQRGRGRRRKAQEETEDMPLFSGSSEKPLADILNSNSGAMKPETLWQASGLSIDDFYKQLKREVESGLIREDKNKQLLSTLP